MTWIQENKHLYEFFNPNWIDIALEMSVGYNCLLHYLPIQTHERPNNNSWNSEISAILPCEIQSFNFDLWENDLWSFFHYKPIF